MAEPRSTSQEEAERALVARVIAGDPEAGDEFVSLYRGRMMAVSLAILGPGDPEAEDAVQETFAAALPALKGFEFRSSIYTWLNQICVRQCYRRIRARSRTALGLESDLAQILGATLAADSGEGALRRLEAERLDWLKKAIASMQSACGKLLTMRDLNGESYGAISRRIKAPIGTVMSRLSRCREKLRDMARQWRREEEHG